jgi:23S rRNA pseudouridine2605 synthase/23S rRNA pseudouridine2604 synthase
MLYYVMYKPRGVVTTNVEASTSTGAGLRPADAGKNARSHILRSVTSVRDLFPPNLRGKIYPVGRLDKDSEGLLLFTNDGVLAYRLTHPKFDHEKEYEVTVTHVIKDGQLKKLEQGMMISGKKTKAAKIKRLNPSRFLITLTEGKNRQIRRMCQKVGAPVETLKRVRIMTLTDASIKPGTLRALTAAEKAKLLAAIDIA